MSRRPKTDGDLPQVGRRHSYVGDLRRLSSVGALLLLAACASLPKHSVAIQAAQVPPPAVDAAWYCSTTYPVQCELPPVQAEPRFYRVQLGGGGISGYPLNITSPSNDECLLLQGPPWVIVNGSCSGSASAAWANITGGTNTTAAMLVGTGASLSYTGSGVVDANEINGLTFPTLVSSDCLTNNGTVLSWGTCGSGGSTTFQVNDTGLASSSTVNFENSAATDGLTLSFSNPSAGNVQLGLSGALTNAGLANPATTVNTETCTLGSTCTIPFQTAGTNNSSQAGLDFITSTVNSVGLTCTFSNPTTFEVKCEITGSSYTGNAATASALAATPSQCSGAEFATGVAANGNANCSTPSGSGITLQTNGTNNSNQTALNLVGVGNVAISNPSGSTVDIGPVSEPLGNSGAPITTSTYTVVTGDCGAEDVLENTSGVTVTVPAASGFSGCQIDFLVPLGYGESVLSPSSGTLGGNSSIVMVANSTCTLNSNGSIWYTIDCPAVIFGGGSGTTVLTSNYTNATTSYTSILAAPSAPASATLHGYCDITWQGSATALTPTFAVELSSTPTDLYVVATYANGTYTVPTTTTITSTTQTAVTPALTTTAATTNYVIKFTFSLINSSSANVLSLYGKSNSSSDTLTVEAGSACGWFP